MNQGGAMSVIRSVRRGDHPLPWSTCAPLWVIFSLVGWLVIVAAGRGVEALCDGYIVL